ncbi:AAA family ATPase [Fusarium circinatum]|uniref:AAA family ATPase n=1 Tax=Fusarium circinatum TaxID=48490 RepID=A0A8H5U5G7_FUSCI|nr:AAA family ATPase [Fusarium circinatum]
MDLASLDQSNSKGSHQEELNEEDQIPSDDGHDYSSEDSETDRRDLYISSTISQDDTRGKGFKERKKLAPLKNKHNAGDISLNTTGFMHAAGPGFLQPPMRPYPGLPAHMRSQLPGRPPFGGILGPASFPTRLMPSGLAKNKDYPEQKVNKDAKWRHSTAEIRHGPAGSGLENNSVTRKALGPDQVQVASERSLVGTSALSNDKTHAESSQEDRINKGSATKEVDNNGFPGGMGLSESLSYIAQKYLGIDMLDQSTEAIRFGGYLLDTIEMLQTQLSYSQARNDSENRQQCYNCNANKHSEQIDQQSRGVSNLSSEDRDKREEEVINFRKLHRIYCSDPEHRHDNQLFEDEPKFINDDAFGNNELTGQMPIKNLARYTSKHASLYFIIIQEHTCNMGFDGPRKRLPSKRLERMRIVSPALRKAVERVAKYPPFPLPTMPIMPFPLEDQESEMDAPYDFFFHHRKELAELEQNSKVYGDVVRPLQSFLDQYYQREYQTAEALFEQGRVTSRHVGKLFEPNRMVVSQHGPTITAYILNSFSSEGDCTIAFRGWSWQVNGMKLVRKTWDAIMDIDPEEEIDITKLSIYPLIYAKAGVEDELEARGEKVWSMKGRHLCVYSGWNWNQDHHYTNARFMIDMSTYQKMHLSRLDSVPIPLRVDRWPVTLHRSSALSREHKMLLPPSAYGFNLEQKNWVSLDVEKIGPINWNKKAFERLVLDSDTKQLIHALIDVKTSKEHKMDDIIPGKGNGLIILLHGSPVTLLSVAEMAKKPLYRVTCGDIGTEAQEVEKYLQSVLYLGKIWDCVLLMDEADVFLEERSMADLQRNSLVSGELIFNGILILTSNRVGTFDEAFKSRIQVAIHYKDLTLDSRKKIWENFFEMIEEANEDVDMLGLKSRLDILAKEEMNGRQIRNALLTARQLAKHRNEQLNWDQLSQVMRTSAAFNKYLKAVRGHSDEQWAREEMLR